MPDEPPVALELTAQEALVLHAWLHRFNEDGHAGFSDHSEQRVLWDLEAMLERQLTAPLDPDYELLLARARSRVRDSEE